MSEQQPTVTESKILREVAEDYIDSLVFTQAKSSTIKIYLRAVQIAVDYFGAQRPVESITLPQVGKFFCSPVILRLPNGRPRADATVKQIRRVFRQCLEFALEKGWITKLVIPKSEMVHARAKTPKQQPPEPAEESTQS